MDQAIQVSFLLMSGCPISNKLYETEGVEDRKEGDQCETKTDFSIVDQKQNAVVKNDLRGGSFKLIN